MLLILVGKAAGGKTVIQERLCECGYTKRITYTTRPPRKGEQNHVTYHFVTNDEFQQKVAEGFFTEYKPYDTKEGRWWYGSKLTDLGCDDEVIILTPAGFREVRDKLGDEVLSIYIYANDATIRKRLADRGDDPGEADRRFQHDKADFKGIECEVDRIVYNNLDDDLNEVVDKILSIVEPHTKKFR